MAILRNSLFIILLIYSCADSAQPNKNVVINNHIEGCFTFTNWQIDSNKEPVLLHASIGSGKKNRECPCKSALFKYTVTQKDGHDFDTLLIGTFTTLNKNTVALPLAVQKQLIFNKVPINLSVTCSSP